jgi:hypothetical protein
VRGAAAAGAGRRRVCGVVQRRAAGGVRGGADVGRQALGGVLLQPQGAAGVLLPVRQEPRIRALHQQPKRAQGRHVLRRRRATMLIDPSSRACTLSSYSYHHVSILATHACVRIYLEQSCTCLRLSRYVVVYEE